MCILTLISSHCIIFIKLPVVISHNIWDPEHIWMLIKEDYFTVNKNNSYKCIVQNIFILMGVMLTWVNHRLSGVHLVQFLVFSVVISCTIACLFDLFWSLFCLFIFDFSFWLLLWWSNFSWYLKNYVNSWWRQYFMVKANSIYL